MDTRHIQEKLPLLKSHNSDLKSELLTFLEGSRDFFALIFKRLLQEYELDKVQQGLKEAEDKNKLLEILFADGYKMGDIQEEAFKKTFRDMLHLRSVNKNFKTYFSNHPEIGKIINNRMWYAYLKPSRIHKIIFKNISVFMCLLGMISAGLTFVVGMFMTPMPKLNSTIPFAFKRSLEEEEWISMDSDNNTTNITNYYPLQSPAFLLSFKIEGIIILIAFSLLILGNVQPAVANRVWRQAENEKNKLLNRFSVFNSEQDQLLASLQYHEKFHSLCAQKGLPTVEPLLGDNEKEVKIQM